MTRLSMPLWKPRAAPLAVLLLAALLLPTIAVAQDTDAPEATAGEPGFSLPVQERVLPNGLSVICVPDASRESVNCRIVYRVGSAYEEPGLTGVAHFLEHLMFKGTDTIGVVDAEADAQIRAELDEVAIAIRALEHQPGRNASQEAELAGLRERMASLLTAQAAAVNTREIWDIYEGAGGSMLNAFTSRDFTQYMVTLPPERLELFMWVESDRMQNAVFREFHSERKVVKEERRLRENAPDASFGEAWNQLVYGAHPYAWPVIGWHEDIDNITRADIRRFYETWYQPDNAAIVLTGNVDIDTAARMAWQYFGHIPRSDAARRHIPVVQPQPAGERRLEATIATQPRVQLEYYRQPTGGGDEAVYMVINALLDGEAGRLQRVLVRDKELASNAMAATMAARFINTFSIHATTKGDITPETLLAAIDEELQALCDEPVGEEELERARNSMRLQLVDLLKNDMMLGVIVGVYECCGGWEILDHTIRDLPGVTAEDVQRVARQMFRRENRCVGLVRRAAEDATPPAPVAPTPPHRQVTDPPVWQPDVEPIERVAHPSGLVFDTREFQPPSPADFRVVLGNGLRVYIKEDRRYPTFSITAHIRGGNLWEPADGLGRAAAAGELMTTATRELNEDELRDRLALISASLSSGFGKDRGNLAMTCFDANVDECLGYFHEMLVRPVFPADALDRWKADMIQMIERRNERPDSIYMRECFQRIYGADHPAARLPDIDAIGRLDAAQLREFHGSAVSPQTVILSVSGNFNREAMLEKLTAVFGDWHADAEAPEPVSEVPAVPEAGDRVVYLYEKPSSQGYVMLGHVGLQRPHPDYYALRLAGQMLQQRLFDNVRKAEGLAYTVAPVFRTPDDYPGVFGGLFQTRSESVRRALELTLAEIERICSEPVPAEELERTRAGLIDGFPGWFGDPADEMAMFANAELDGRPLDIYDRLRDRLRAITPEQILEAARRHIHPERMTIVIVGEPDAIAAGEGPVLESFGRIETIVVEASGEFTPGGPDPTGTIARAFGALRDGDIDTFIACHSSELRPQFTEAERRAMVQQMQMITDIAWEFANVQVDGASATVDVTLTLSANGQEFETPTRTVELVLEEGEWRINSN